MAIPSGSAKHMVTLTMGMAIPTPIVPPTHLKAPQQPLIVHSITDLKSCRAVIHILKNSNNCPDRIYVSPGIWHEIYRKLLDEVSPQRWPCTVDGVQILSIIFG